MVTSRETLEKIRRIIAKHYSMLTVSVLGAKVFNEEELAKLRAEGVDTSNPDSILSAVYYQNFINNPLSHTSPATLKQMLAQQKQPGIKPTSPATEYSVSSINDRAKQFIDKMSADVSTRIENMVRDNNDTFKFKAMNDPERSDFANDLMKESSLGKVKQRLRDSSHDGNRDWMRIALTEMSNAIGIGSVDRIAEDNAGKDLEDVYVYRVIVGDSLTCKFCRKFYGNVGHAPKLYRLSTLLANGSNWGPSSTWQPVVGATHPNTRTSQIIELRPGYKVLPGGSVTYIGLDKWHDYIQEALVD